MAAASIKKGSFVTVVREKLDTSLESQASDRRFPSYLFDSKGEVMDIKDEYALLRFHVPTPAVWLRLDQLQVVD
ncbi:MAG: NAD(P)H-quinone oxidoreductase subunit O [Snowella sp.]|nr:NAD(P)H-quinone oxidoreductase subunit O [Snowella sp.]